jgi:succinate-semialdehyde dehydrogenase / glutarate-semialdehyde dehydrogenase
VCEYYAQNAESFLMNEPLLLNIQNLMSVSGHLGLFWRLCPGIFPSGRFSGVLLQHLWAGNTMLLKHASNVSGCSLAIEDLFREAGFPENAFRSLLMSGTRLEPVIAHPAVKAVTLTGSTPAGKSIASAAGNNLKKSVMELGGSDPYIILEDADLAHAVQICVSSRLLNAGQSCIAAKRFIVVEPVHDEFCRLMVQKIKEASWGDPFDEETTIGPLARTDLREELHQQVVRSVQMGANLRDWGFYTKWNGFILSTNNT